MTDAHIPDEKRLRLRAAFRTLVTLIGFAVLFGLIVFGSMVFWYGLIGALGLLMVFATYRFWRSFDGR